jgi:hypothetical protein
MQKHFPQYLKQIRMLLKPYSMVISVYLTVHNLVNPSLTLSSNKVNNVLTRSISSISKMFETTIYNEVYEYNLVLDDITSTDKEYIVLVLRDFSKVSNVSY